MSNIIDSIQLSGVTYGIKGSGGTETIELTQAQYDALVDKDPNTFYVITDAQAGDLTNYYTKTETNTLLGGKADTATTYTKTEVDTALASKADTATTYTKTETNTLLGGKADTSAVTAIQDSLSGYVTTKGTEQIISGRKIFTYSSSSSKAIEFKQTDDTTKLGFAIKNSASTNNEVASFEFRPNTFTIDGVQHPLLYFGHYRNTSTANAGVPQTVIGFRQYDQKNAAAYHYLMPLPEKAKTPFSLTTSFKDYYAPMGFKNGSTMITADNTGVVDLSSEFSGKVDTSLYNTYTAATDTALASKQTTLTAGTGISIIDNVISAEGGGMTEDDELLLSTALTDLNDRKIDASEVKSNYQRKGDYATKDYVATALEPYETKANVEQAEEVTAYALNDLNQRFGGLKITKITESEYAALTTKDENTLYIVVADPS